MSSNSKWSIFYSMNQCPTVFGFGLSEFVKKKCFSFHLKRNVESVLVCHFRFTFENIFWICFGWKKILIRFWCMTLCFGCGFKAKTVRYYTSMSSLDYVHLLFFWMFSSRGVSICLAIVNDQSSTQLISVQRFSVLVCW